MFSGRLNIEFEPNRLSQLYEAKKSAGEKILDLTSSNPTKSGFVYDEKHILAASGKESLSYNPDARGIITARETVRNYYNEIGRIISVNDIFITPGTSEAYSYLFKLLLNPGDEILIPQPCYPLFEYLAMLDSGSVSYYPLTYNHKNGWKADLQRLSGLVTPKTKAIVIVNPNNPTGSYLKRDEYEAITEICGKNNIALISDEVFSDYSISPGENYLRTVAGEKSYLNFILNGYSKMLALPQVKFGWILVEGNQQLKNEAVKRLEIISDTYLSVSSMVQNSSEILYGTRGRIQKQIIERLNRNYEMLSHKFLLNPNIRLLKCEGGWSAVISFGNMLIPEDDFVFNLLERKNVLVHPGYYYDFDKEGYAVISLLTDTDILEEGINRLLSIYN